MIGIAITFDLGRYHANPWGEHVNEGLVEWPPSPWRILRSLYAVSRTNLELDRRRGASDRALERLMAGDPPVYSVPASTEAHTRHFLPSRGWSPAKPGATDLVLDAFHAVAPGDELIAWWTVELPDEEREALACVVSALGHLGRSEAVCSARLVSGRRPDTLAARPADERSRGDTVDLLCPVPQAGIDDISISVAALRRRRLRKPPRTRVVAYELRQPLPPAGSIAQPRIELPQLGLLRLGGSNRPGLAEAVALAQSLRSAAQARFGRLTGGATSATFSGRIDDAPRTDQHRHAHYIVLPDSDGRRAERLVVWAPEGLDEREIQALASLRSLAIRGVGDPLPLALAALGSLHSVRLPELLGPSRWWHSLTPFGLVRHPKVRGGRLCDAPEEQVRLELERRSFPQPRHVSLVRGQWHRFRSSRVGTSRLQRARVFGVRLEFAEPVSGPIALGALCHFGLGVFRPE